VKLLAVGSVGLDTVETPHGRVVDVPGGSVVFFGLAASFFTPLAIAANLGDDFPDSAWDPLRRRGADLSGLRTLAGEKTFRWEARYEGEMEQATTLRTELNVLEHAPVLPAGHEDADILFLANMGADVQLATLRAAGIKRAWADTMNLWIDTQRDDLESVLSLLEGLFLNEEEALQLTGASSLEEAGNQLLGMGPRIVVVKLGARGAVLVTGEGQRHFAAYPAKPVIDPTGAGDSFAGGFLGYLASKGTSGDWPTALLQDAVIAGTATASMAVESFSIQRIAESERPEIESRMDSLKIPL
jgi:sugar/nucleoside kinase (ribokinase family)